MPSLSDPMIPSPELGPTLFVSKRYSSMVEAGLELLGVPFGVPVGVDEALSTRDFLEDDLGVILELKKAFTGVDMSSIKPARVTGTESL